MRPLTNNFPCICRPVLTIIKLNPECPAPINVGLLDGTNKSASHSKHPSIIVHDRLYDTTVVSVRNGQMEMFANLTVVYFNDAVCSDEANVGLIAALILSPVTNGYCDQLD